ncbi:Uncharacterized protein dnm_006410 [Desulfonema magnum]|uniref:Uncharacterized protein n=1 Tax=Desulfonema magnum TaxID=45655 RepID=A0A975GKH7_9BACT|nr:Uncharacterized protein dnm_006410 [Desulfonema magnum]
MWLCRCGYEKHKKILILTDFVVLFPKVQGKKIRKGKFTFPFLSFFPVLFGRQYPPSI